MTLIVSLNYTWKKELINQEVVYNCFFCGKSSGWEAPTWCHLACSCKSKDVGYCKKRFGVRERESICCIQLATLHSFFFSGSTTMFTSFSRTDTFFFSPCAFSKQTPSPSLRNASHSKPRPYFYNCHFTCSCLPDDFPQKNQLYTTQELFSSSH